MSSAESSVSCKGKPKSGKPTNCRVDVGVANVPRAGALVSVLATVMRSASGKCHRMQVKAAPITSFFEFDWDLSELQQLLDLSDGLRPLPMGRNMNSPEQCVRH